MKKISLKLPKIQKIYSFRARYCKILITIIVLVLGIVIFFIKPSAKVVAPTELKGYSQKIVEVDGHTINAWVADDSEKQEKGLSVVDSMSDDQGMLFNMEKPAVYSFWMKDMKFPIDTVWIRNGKVVDISSDMTLEQGSDTSKYKIYKSKSNVDQVLELNTGWCYKYGLKLGDEVKVK